MPRVERITLFPIKSLDGHEVRRAEVLPSGMLKFDRRWAVLDRQGRKVNAKSNPRIQQIRANYDLREMWVELSSSSAGSAVPDRLSLEAPERVAEWLSTFLGFACRLLENDDQGFPDDMDAMGPTIVSRETLQQVAAWFPPLSLDEVRRRFRSNLELAAGIPFWEDRLYGPDPRHVVRFELGELAFVGIRPCERCVVPSRSSESGTPDPPGFAKEFAIRREQTLPDFAARPAFDHFYRLAVNTRLASLDRHAAICLGDELTL